MNFAAAKTNEHLWNLGTHYDSNGSIKTIPTNLLSIYQGRAEPIQIGNEPINREGLGSQAIDSDKINRDEAEEIVRTYAASNRMDDLVFSSELNFDERKEIRYMAKRYGLTEKMVVQPVGRVSEMLKLTSFYAFLSGLISIMVGLEGPTSRLKAIIPGTVPYKINVDPQTYF